MNAQVICKPLSREAARELIATIKARAHELRSALIELYEGRGWEVLGLFSDEHGDGLYVDFDLRRFGLTLRQVLPPCEKAQEARLGVSLDEPIKGRRMSVSPADVVHFETHADKPILFFSQPVLSRAYCDLVRLRMTDVTGAAELFGEVLLWSLRFKNGAIVGRFIETDEFETLRLYIGKAYDLKPLMAHLEAELGVQCLMVVRDAN